MTTLAGNAGIARVRLPSGAILVWGIGALVAFLALYPLGWIVYGSLRDAPPLEPGVLTLDNFKAYSDPLIFRTIWNTLRFSLGQTAVAVGIGTIFAWIIARTNTPGRRVFEFLLLLLFLFPLLLAVVAWTMLLSPGKGLINHMLMAVLGLDSAPFNIYSLGGMIFVQGLYLTPLAYLIIAPSISSMDSGLEESARMSGAGIFSTLRRITLPLAMPAILSAAILMFIIGLESFDVPQLLGATRGIFTYTSLIYSSLRVQYPPNYGVSTTLAVSLLVISIICVYGYRLATRRMYRYETVKGKGYRAKIIDLGHWRWVTSAGCWFFFVVAVFLPVGILILGSLLQYYGRFDWAIFSRMSFDNYPRVFSHPTLVRGFINSLLLAIVGGAACVVLATTISYIVVRSKLRGRGALESIAMLPFAIPGTVLGLGLLWGYIVLPVPIYGTLAILAIAYVTRYLPIGLRAVSGGMIQIDKELDEASRVSGASWLGAFRYIIAPLLRPTLFAAWLLLFMVFIRELPMSILLAGTGNPVISAVMFDYYQSGELGSLSAVAVLMTAVILVVLIIARRFVMAGAARFG